MPKFADTDFVVLTREAFLRLVAETATPAWFDKLTRREREVIELVDRGLSHEEIAHRLGIKASSVRTYMKRSYRKTGATNAHALARGLQKPRRQRRSTPDQRA